MLKKKQQFPAKTKIESPNHPKSRLLPIEIQKFNIIWKLVWYSYERF